jgi:REP element-mobilizing transposase RayT
VLCSYHQLPEEPLLLQDQFPPTMRRSPKVQVFTDHAPIHDLKLLQEVQTSFHKIAAKKGHRVSRLSVLPDHVHAAMRGNPHESPFEIGFTYQNNLAYMTRKPRLWQPGFYIGTFGEYAMHAVRNHGHDVL